MWKRVLLVGATCFLLRLDTEASTIRNSFMDNLNSGLKMLGISNKIADLVSQTFAPHNGKRDNIRQDAIVIGGDSSPMAENTLMGGMLKLLGFDSSKIGAVAVNGIIFIAQMVRYGASRFMNYMMTKTWDWYRIVDYISERVMNDTSYETTTASVLRF